MNPTTPIDTAIQAHKLLVAARTAIAIVSTMNTLLWELHADEILAIQEDDEKRVVELLAMALVDQAWPLENDDDPFCATG